MMYSKHIPKILSLTLVVFLSGVLVAHAVETPYFPLAPLPIGEGGAIPMGKDASGKLVPMYASMGTYLAGMMKFLIAIGGVIAIVVAIIGGVQRIASGISPSAKADANKRIENALVGLALVLTSYLILNSINPDLVKLNLDLTPVIGEQLKVRTTEINPAIDCPKTKAKHSIMSIRSLDMVACKKEKAERQQPQAQENYTITEADKAKCPKTSAASPKINTRIEFDSMCGYEYSILQRIGAQKEPEVQKQ